MSKRKTSYNMYIVSTKRKVYLPHIYEKCYLIYGNISYIYLL